MKTKVKFEQPVDFVAAAADAGEAAPMGPRKFAIRAYTGAAIRQAWSKEPIVIDLAGMKMRQKIPIVMGHDYGLGSILGQTTSVRAEGGELIVEGEILASTEDTMRVVELADKGFQWQASVGADVGRHERIPADQTVTINGQSFHGPIRIVKASTLREVSFVTLGADDATTVQIAADAAEETTMAHDANEQPAEAVTAAVEAPATVAVEAPASAPAVVAESQSPDLTATVEALNKKLQTMEKLIATRSDRAPAIHVAEPQTGGNVIEAALCMQGGLSKPEKFYDERTVEAAAKQQRSVSLGEVFVEAARANGYSGSSRISSTNLPMVIRAAFATHQISDLLANVANKFLLNGFMAVERTWDQVAAVRSVNDFKSINLYRLNGSFKFQKVGNAGQMQSAEATDYKRSVNADTYGITSSLTRTDMINDDLGALSAIPQRIGRGAALSLAETVWNEFQTNNATYYSKATAAAGNALSLSSLKTAATAYRKLTDPDGNPLGIMPSILLVPPELELTAAELMTSSLLISGNTTAQGSTNVLRGRYRVVTSAYLTSASTWWLCADAGDLPSLDVVFLNGQQTPTIEQVQAAPDSLGVNIRGYMDFGVVKGESLAAYRMATA
jgi:phage major head subunit gpT-like protein